MIHNFEHVFRGLLTIFWGKVFCFFFSLILCPALQGSLFFYYWHLKVLGIFWIQFLCQNMIAGLPWRCSGQDSSCQRRGRRFDPWPKKISCAAEQVKPCVTTAGPVGCKYWSPLAWSLTRPQGKLLQGEAWAPRQGAAPTHRGRRRPHGSRDPAQANTDAKEHDWHIVSVGLWFAF